MAGIYPDFTGHRLAYDVDGTNLYKVGVAGAGFATLQLTTSMQNMNDEDSTDSYAFASHDGGYPNPIYNALVFPQSMNLTHYTIHWDADTIGWVSGAQTVEVSPDTTDGLNGSWTQVQSGVTSANNVQEWRASLTALSGASNVRGIRFRWTPSSTNNTNTRIRLLHLYGAPVELPPALWFWDPFGDTRLGPAALDFGDLVAGEVKELSFRIKNTTTLTANNILIGVESNTPNQMSSGTSIQFSIGGDEFATTKTIGALTPEEMSPVITMRRTVVSTGAVLAKNAVRVKAVAGSWT